ncbi:membrane-bound lytic murein transglycosylase MltF [Salicola sp. Rm-C-2C1-2]|uniref:membrane-bound lytic murein transglycosylase MltF n=1 Tax=Salicola sp. Rm-C-2C1-2 TaxID=3141321 RepID=UPI0032E41A34
MRTSTLKRLGMAPRLAIRLAAPVLLALVLTACSQPTTLDRINQESVLHVVMHPASTVYYEENGEPSGFEYELVRRFADSLGVELRVEVVDDLPELYQRLDEHHTHLAAAGLALTPELQRRYRHGPVYDRSRPIVVYNADVARPSSPTELAQLNIAVRAGSAAEQQLERVREVIPGMNWQAETRQDPTELLHRVDQGDVEATVINSRELENNQVFFSNVRDGFALSSPRPVGWLLPPAGDGSLMQAARDFFRSIRADGTLAQLQERFFGHLDHLDYVGAKTFTTHLDNRLPKYRETFMGAASAHDLDWRLLAAIGYQESHWEPRAVSPTGVRGLMMLTRDTAALIGVKNRLDPQASIWGGARFFRRLHNRIPDNIKEPDRTWFALAAYNVGYGHLQDARRLARRDGSDPNRWLDVKQYLPLLAQRQYYTQTRYGYARGYEPVLYTQNIRRYYDVLKWMFPDEDTTTAIIENGVESPLEDTGSQPPQSANTAGKGAPNDQRQQLREASPLL